MESRSSRRNPWLTHVPEGPDPQWLTSQCELIPLSQILDSHLLNIERLLLGRGRVDPSSRQNLFTRWYHIIRDEIERRGLEPIPEDHTFAIIRQEGKESSHGYLSERKGGGCLDQMAQHSHPTLSSSVGNNSGDGDGWGAPGQGGW